MLKWSLSFFNKSFIMFAVAAAADLPDGGITLPPVITRTIEIARAVAAYSAYFFIHFIKITLCFAIGYTYGATLDALLIVSSPATRSLVYLAGIIAIIPFSRYIGHNAHAFFDPLADRAFEWIRG